MPIGKLFAHSDGIVVNGLVFIGCQVGKPLVNITDTVDDDTYVILPDERGHSCLTPYNDRYSGTEIERSLVRIVYLQVFAPSTVALVD